MTHVNSSKNSEVQVILLIEDDWARYRDIRLAALAHDESAFGGDYDSESQYSEVQWRQKAQQYVGLLAAIDGKDCGFMSIEKLLEFYKKENALLKEANAELKKNYKSIFVDIVGGFRLIIYSLYIYVMWIHYKEREDKSIKDTNSTRVVPYRMA